MKKIIGIYQSPRSHWVGDGFPVRSMFSYNDHGKYLNPFLLLDRAGPLISQAQIQQTEALESTHTVGLKQSRLCMMVKSPTMTLRVKVV